MKKFIEEVSCEGLELLMGEVVTLFCARYIYTGKLVGVNDKYVKLENAGIVYETGCFTDTKWQDMQKLPNDWYVELHAIESFGKLK